LLLTQAESGQAQPQVLVLMRALLVLLPLQKGRTATHALPHTINHRHHHHHYHRTLERMRACPSSPGKHV